MDVLKVAACAVTAGALLFAARSAEAGTITSVGAVKPLTNVSQVAGVIGHGNFDEGPTSGNVPANVYSAQGLTWQQGAMTTVFPGCQCSGTAYLPQYAQWTYFPAPIGGGGVATGNNNNFAGVARFSVNVTQVGLTASSNGQQFLTAFNAAGQMIGQVTWTPSGDSSFVGIDTQGVPIAMITYGNHNLWAGQPYDVTGLTIISDSWIWGAGACSSDTQCDDGNPCTTDVCNVSAQCVHVNNSAACNDNNACTQTDVCNNGVCTGTNPVTCTAQDQCHTAGTCNTTTGACSNPSKSDGSSCSDGSLCTQTDTCQAGVCVGGNPVSCTAQDNCHIAGTCNPATGVCSNPNAANGTSCQDANQCIPVATCFNGVCDGPVKLCPPTDQCHGSGTCDPTSGVCTNPSLPDGTTCTDGNACTQGDTCKAGVCAAGNAVTCTASDQCHAVGTCDPNSGQCSNPAKTDGTSCDDGNKCTTTDTCQSGTCTGANPVTCKAQDQCHTAGTCDTTTGLCSNPSLSDGTTCDDGNKCTSTDTCQAGVCKGASPVVCTAQDNCHSVGTCDTTTGKCSNPPVADGTACTDNNSCFNGDSCQAGVCTHGTPVPCTAMDECHDVGTCDSTSGKCSNPVKTDGTACSGGGTCESGSCVRPDAGHFTDGGGGGDGGSASDGGHVGDSGSGLDSGINPGLDASAGGDGGNADTGASGGCGCRVTGTRTTGGALAGLAVLALFAVRRRRR
jgi:MYXO-CTERM domain-containing protein